MELNRDQIIKALEVCLVEHSCEGCHYEYFQSCLEKLGADTLSIIKSQEQRIKELTDENAKLARSCTELEQKCASLTSESVEKCASVKADTVRKMQDLIKEKCKNLFSGLDVCIIVDQIANELLEGSDET